MTRQVGAPVTGATAPIRPCIDALYHVAERLGSDAELAARARESLLARAAGRRLVLVTAHRRENFGAGFEEICRALAAIGARDDVVIVTDSGGIQEEALAFGKPVLVMRDVTERPEAVAAGTVRLVGTDSDVRVAYSPERAIPGNCCTS